MTAELILTGGRVIDPAQDIDMVTEVAFADGRVQAVGDALPRGPETRVRDVTGRIVTPGLIDLHTHVYWGGTSLGIDAEEFCRTSGVTTAVDTGSAGPGNFPGFRAPAALVDDAKIDPPTSLEVEELTIPFPKVAGEDDGKKK